MSPEDEQRIGEIIAAQLAKLMPTATPPIPPATPATLSLTLAPATPDASQGKGSDKHALPTSPELLARDAADPLRNEYTALARQLGKDERRVLYFPIWDTERKRLLALGLGKQGANKQAQSNYSDRLKIERARLLARDGITRTTMAPAISAESRRSSGLHSDPTANEAIGNVTREERAAKLRAELAALESEATGMVVLPIERKAASTMSLAQRAVGANGYERTIAKLVRDAVASQMPGTFISQWWENQKAKTLENPKYKTQESKTGRLVVIQKQAFEACRRLNIPVS